MSDSYRDLLAWQKAMELAVEVKTATLRFPREEVYSLRQQVNKAAMSVPSNIAEGKGRLSKKEFVQFPGWARGSLYETETQLELGFRFGYLQLEARDALFAISAETGSNPEWSDLRHSKAARFNPRLRRTVRC